MNIQLQPGKKTGTVTIPSSKSQMHRLLICAALGTGETAIRYAGMSKDIAATIACLNALGADIREVEDGLLQVKPIRSVPGGCCDLYCGESGSTLRFMLPIVGALGAEAVFHMEGRLPQRPMAPFDAELTAHGMYLRKEGDLLYCGGQLLAGSYSLPGNVSSQYISGLQLALPLTDGESSIEITGKLESSAYIDMTTDTLALAGVHWVRENNIYRLTTKVRPALPALCRAEGDFSNAAFFLCMGALSPEGVTVEGLSAASSQGDRGVVEILRRFGAEIAETETSVSVRRGQLRGITIDAAPVPDLIPVLSVVAAVAEGETNIINAGRLRLKESDRIESTAALLKALGGEVTELPEGMIICGKPELQGGTADSCGDHRIAMSAAVAATVCRESVLVCGSECTAKSYPRFWEDLAALKEVRS